MASLSAWRYRTAITQSAGTGPPSSLVCGPASRPWRRQLGAARLGGAGGTGPHRPPRRPRMGITGRAAPPSPPASATTAATAVRAVAALAAAGLVVLRTSRRPERAAPLGLSAASPRRDRAAPLSPSKRRCRTGSTSRLSRRPGRSLSEQVRPSSEQPQTITGVRPIRTPCWSARSRWRPRARIGRARPQPPRHHQSSGRHTRSSDERKRAHARRAQPVGPSRRLPAAQPLRQPQSSPPTPAPRSRTASPARSTRTGSFPRRNASAEPSAPARPTTQPWPPNPPEPGEAGARSGLRDRPKMTAEPDAAAIPALGGARGITW